MILSLLSKNQIDHEEYENRAPESLGSTLRAPGPQKTEIRSLFHDWKLWINEIEQQESENHDPETSMYP